MLRFCKRCNEETDRYACSGECRPCGRKSRQVSVAKWRANNPEKVKALSDRAKKRYKEKHAEADALRKAERAKRKAERAVSGLAPEQLEIRRAKCRIWRAANPQKALAAARAWAEANPDRVRELSRLRIRRKAGWSDGRFEAVWSAQNGCCAICTALMVDGGKHGKSATADHCHKTGKPRGLLCAECNRALGCFKDDPAILRRAATYLEEFL